MTDNTIRIGVINNQLSQANSDLAQVGSEVLQLIMNKTSFTSDLPVSENKLTQSSRW